MIDTQRFTRLAAALGGIAALAFAATAGAQAPLRIGFVYVSPIGDAGWTFQHDQARKEMEKALAGKVETKYVENVPEGADSERVIRELASAGNKLIFTTSFGYMNPTIKVAQQFPDTMFEHATGYKTAKNVGVYNARFYEGRYLCGIVAGRMTKSNVAGYVAAFPIPEVVQGIDAFVLGMRSVNPKAELKVIWTSSWYDPAREREAANALVAQGADVLTHHTDSTAVVQVAEEKSKYAIAYHSDMSKYGPHAQLTASTHQWGAFYVKTAQEALAGTWKPTSIWGGIKEGMVKLAPLNPVVPKDVADLVAAKTADIAAGRFHPFTGPIKDSGGKERLAAGKVMSDDALQKLDWYVEGVQGSLPKK
jgi:simple sugar transport system substrate-binding protein